MVTKRNQFIRFAFVFAVCLAIWACSNEEKTSEIEAPVQTQSFRDASQGLPETGHWRQNIAFYDLNGDGFLDILSPPPRKPDPGEDKPAIWYGTANSLWKKGKLNVPEEIPYAYGSIAVADFNEDQIPDLALAMHVLQARMLLGTSNGKYADFSKGLPTETEFSSRACTVSDLNNDGKPDLLMVSEAQFRREDYIVKGVMACYLDKKAWRCEEIQKDRVGAGVFADQIVTGDINGDGNVDIAVGLRATEKNRVVWLGNGKGGFTAFNKGLPKDKAYYSVAVGDINKDGKEDLVASISGFGRDALYGPRIFLSGSDGFTEASRGLPEKENVRSLALGDLDGDGSLDIICGTGEGGVKVYTQKDDGGWKEMSVSGFPTAGLERIYGIYCVDINQDGHADVVLNCAPNQGGEKGGIRVFLRGADAGSQIPAKKE
jgi:hypothetical protein